ncbi:MAG: helix-turn-helix transcriptional regulator [Kiritimatiellae bacterium]|nr:helix-turn-helix transcriptional regulator [Kiritimatiellia bacterium]
MQKRRKSAQKTVYGMHPLPSEFPLRFYVRWSEGDDTGPHGETVGCHNGLELGYCHEGEGVFSIGGRLFPFGPRAISVVAPMVPHATWSRHGTRSTWSFILTDPARLLFGGPAKNYALFDTTRFAGPQFRSILSAGEYPAIEALILKALEEHDRAAPHYEAAIRACFLALLVELNRLPGTVPTNGVAVRDDLVERLTPALRQIQRDYTRKIAVDRLSALCGMSKSHFRQIFKEAMGKSPYEYLTEYRVAMACLDLKENKKTVESIAWDNGFPTVSCFARKFKAIMGVAPRTWAKAQGE